MAILTKLLYLNLGCLLLASHPAAASFGNACLLARANKKTVRNDLKTCFEDMRGDDTWNYKWCANNTFYRDGKSWKHPRDCTTNCASCLHAAFDSGADAAFCWQRAHAAACQMGYSRRVRDNLMCGDEVRVCDHVARAKDCNIREAQVAWVNLARPEDDTWKTGEYWSRYEFVDVQAPLDRVQAGRDCSRGGCMYDAGGDAAWRLEPPWAQMEEWRIGLNLTPPVGDVHAGVPESPPGPVRSPDPRPVDIDWKHRWNNPERQV